MLDVALRSAVILAAAWLLTKSLTRGTAATRHLVWHASLLAVLMAPALSVVAPEIAVPGIPALPGVVGVPAVDTVATHGQTGTPSAGARGTSISTLGGRTTIARAPAIGPATLGALAWAAGSAGLLVWFALGWLATASRTRRAQRAPAAWQIEANALCARMRIRREVRVRVSADESSPVATGLARPAIVFPASALSWDADRRRAVLLHELAHIRRADCRVQAIAQAACALYWFNPLVWLAAASLRRERERACDDEVLRHGAQPSAYAAHLVAIARGLQASLRPSAALAMARPSELEGRVVSVLAIDRPRIPARGTRWSVALASMGVTAFVLGAAPVVDTSPAPEPPPSAARAFVVVNQAAIGDEAAGARPDTLEPLVSALAQGDADVREKAAMSLALQSSPEAIAPLLTALADREAQVREKAAIGLALRRDPRVVEALIAAMRDPDAQVREKVAIALGTSGDPRAAAVLQRALADRDEQVREKAAAGLILLNTPVDETQAARLRDGLRDVVGGLLALAR
jgi:beta-lactamase regulating signal transducer with metallopeptidase domain